MALRRDQDEEVGTAPSATSTQVGAIGECIVAAEIMEISKGRLSPFKPIADDGGIDLLLFDKITRVPIPLQIKCRRTHTGPKARKTYQFDVRRKTFSNKSDGYFIFAKLSGTRIDAAWLIPSNELESVARLTPTHLVSVACPTPTSKDCFTPYRLDSMEKVVARIFERERLKTLR